MAILHFLEKAYPTTGYCLVPKNLHECANSHEIAELSLQLTHDLDIPHDFRKCHHENMEFFLLSSSKLSLLETRLQKIEKLLHVNKKVHKGPFAGGGFSPSIADICLIPQLRNIEHYGVSLKTTYPALYQLENQCKMHAWFQLTYS